MPTIVDNEALNGSPRLWTAKQSATLHEALPWTTGTTTVTVVDGTGEEVASGEATSVASEWEYTIPATLMQELGARLITWTCGDESVQTVLDVRGGQVHPLAELARSLTKGNGAENASAIYPVWRQRQELDGALLDLESACEVRLTLKRSVETFWDLSCATFGQYRGLSSGLRVAGAYPRRLVAVDEDGADLSTARVDTSRGIITLPDGVSTPVTIAYDHGEIGPAHDVQRAIVALASTRLASGAADDRGFLVHGEQGATRLLTAGIGGAKFSVPEAQALFKRHRALLIR